MMMGVSDLITGTKNPCMRKTLVLTGNQYLSSYFEEPMYRLLGTSTSYLDLLTRSHRGELCYSATKYERQSNEYEYGDVSTGVCGRKILTSVPPSVHTSSSKPSLDLSSHLPSSLRPSTSSPPPIAPPIPSHSDDVQGQTSVSKGGFVVEKPI
ncbi:unnamed protein product [Mucor hiemalis]